MSKQKTIAITDPCYTTNGTLQNEGSYVKLDVSDIFFKILQLHPTVDFNEKDNFEGGTYWFGKKLDQNEYEYVGYHYNDAGMTSIVDLANIRPFDWDKIDIISKEKNIPCNFCNATGLIDEETFIKEKPALAAISKDPIFRKCSACYGEKKIRVPDYSKCVMNTHHFLMAGSTFLGDVGASVFIHKRNGEIDSLAIDVCCYSFNSEKFIDNLY